MVRTRRLPVMGDATMSVINGRRTWTFPDGTTLPVVSGGDGPDDDDDDDASDDADDSDDDKDDDDGDGDGDVDKLKAALAKERQQRREAAKQLKKANADLAAAKRSGLSDDDRKLEEAKEAGRAEARAEVAEKLVRAELRAVTADRLDDETLETILDGINASKFVDDDGEVDTEKVKTLAKAFVTKADDEDPDGKKKSRRDVGQGRRGSTTQKPSVESGRSLFADRHKKSS